MEHLIDIADSYINEEEMGRIKYAGRQLTERRKNRNMEREGTSNLPRKRSPLRRFSDYTPLSVPRKEIYLSIRDEDMLKTPRKLPITDKNRSSDKYYLFHKQRGHDTEDCFQLRDEIERLI